MKKYHLEINFPPENAVCQAPSTKKQYKKRHNFTVSPPQTLWNSALSSLRVNSCQKQLTKDTQECCPPEPPNLSWDSENSWRTTWLIYSVTIFGHFRAGNFSPVEPFSTLFRATALEIKQCGKNTASLSLIMQSSVLFSYTVNKVQKQEDINNLSKHGKQPSYRFPEPLLTFMPKQLTTHMAIGEVW